MIFPFSRLFGVPLDKGVADQKELLNIHPELSGKMDVCVSRTSVFFSYDSSGASPIDGRHVEEEAWEGRLSIFAGRRDNKSCRNVSS